MKDPYRKRVILVGLAFLFCFALRARANVYATDIRVNGSFCQDVFLPGDMVTISYILNDAATGGVWVQIESGTNVVKTFSSTNETAGTNAGLNSITWDGTTDCGSNAMPAAYRVKITAAATGYHCWTNITDDGSNFYAQEPRGIAVNQHTNSPYYGRVYVADAPCTLCGGGTPGIIKCNADGSPADEGGFSTGGVEWGGNGFSPWKLCIGPDDRIYVNDFSDQGVVFSFDQTISDTNALHVIRTDNYPPSDPSVNLSGLSVLGASTNMEIWMTDEYPYASAGVLGWRMTNGVASPDDPGTVIAPVDSSYLTQAPYDLSVDTNGFIYTIQQLTNGGPPSYALLSFPPYTGTPETTADWADAIYPALQYCYGVAVDPTAATVAVAALGDNPDYEKTPENIPTGGIYLFSTDDGEALTKIDPTRTSGYFGVAWDNVGNLYALDGTSEAWRVYSPPGTNQATTIGVPIIQVYNALTSPSLCMPATNPDGFNFMLVGQSYITYIIQKSCDLINWTNVVTNYSANADRCISVPVCDRHNFYRAVASP